MSRLRSWHALSAVIAMFVVTLSSTPASAQGTYEWKLDCHGDDGGAGASWNWTLGGVPIPAAGGTAVCSGGSAVSGTGNRPANADGLVAELGGSVPCDTGFPCYDNDVLTMSFEPGSKVKVNLAVHYNGKVNVCYFLSEMAAGSSIVGAGFNCLVTMSGGAHFSLSG